MPHQPHGAAPLQEAEYHYREALRINPRNLNTHFNLGALLTAELGRHKEAEGHYRAALCIDPEDPIRLLCPSPDPMAKYMVLTLMHTPRMLIRTSI